MSKLISKIIKPSENANRTIILPLIGEVQFDDNGELEVEDDKVESVIALTTESFDFKVVGAPEPPKSEDDKEIEEYKELLEMVSETELLELVRDCGDPVLKEKAAAMSNEKIKKALIKLYKTNLKKK